MEARKARRCALNLVQMSLSSAGILVISGVIGLGVNMSTYLQIAGYSLGYSAVDAARARFTPSWLFEKGDIDTPQPLLTPGPLIEAIVDETFKLRATEEQVGPYLALVNDLGAFREYLMTQRAILEAAATITWSGLLETDWMRAASQRLETETKMAAVYSTESYYRGAYRDWIWKWGHHMSVFNTWIEGNRTMLKELEGNMTRLREGVVEDILWAWGKETSPLLQATRALAAEGAGQINLTYVDGTLLLGDLYGPFREQIMAVERAIYAAAGDIPVALVNYTLFQTQRHVVVERMLRPLERAIQIETGRTNYRVYKTQRDEQNQVMGRIRTAFELFRKECQSDRQGHPIECGQVNFIGDHLVGFFKQLRGWGYAIPETALELILKSPGGEKMSRRDLNRAMAVEEFRRSPSPYPTMILVGALLGFTAFWMSFLYSFFTILNMGLLGTAGNLVGVAYEWTGGLHDRAQISRQRLKLETRRPLLLEQRTS